MEIKLNLKPKIEKILIVHSLFNNFIVKELLSASIKTLFKHNLKEKNIDTIAVPGAYEIPLSIKSIISKRKYDGILGLGCIIQGETSHHTLIMEHLNSLGNLSLANNLPLTLGILTVKNLNQAIERSGGKLGNKGEEAANALIEMIKIVQLEF